MLMLARRIGQRIVINKKIIMTVTEFKNGHPLVSFTAPNTTSIKCDNGPLIEGSRIVVNDEVNIYISEIKDRSTVVFAFDAPKSVKIDREEKLSKDEIPSYELKSDDSIKEDKLKGRRQIHRR